MTSPDPARRTLLTAIAGLMALAVLPGDWVARRWSTWSPLSPLDALLQRVRATPGAAAIAAAWQARQLAPSTPAELRERLAQDIGPAGEHLAAAVAQDFAAGRMLLVDGWPVAESEARLCALAQVEQG